MTVCADRAVLLGHKSTFVGGPAEANALRLLLAASPALRGLSFHFPSSAEDPTSKVRVLVLDRAKTNRPFANAAQLVEVVRGYGIAVTYMDGDGYEKLTFSEQARLFNRHQLVIAAHGAALSNMVFMPPRSVVIEVYPRGSWKPGYAKIAAALGHVHIPVFSFTGGGRRHSAAPYVRIPNKDACALLSYPRLTRDICFPWVRALPVHVPLGHLEHALVAGLNIVSHTRVEPKGLAAAYEGGALPSPPPRGAKRQQQALAGKVRRRRG